MSREIKFRQPVLDNTGKFLYWHYWGFIHSGHFSGPETNSCPIHLAQERSQQFTGFHDKNGKEIYEGDVVKDNAGQVNPITYDAGTYWFNWLHLVDALEPLEVISNTYEPYCQVEAHP